MHTTVRQWLITLFLFIFSQHFVSSQPLDLESPDPKASGSPNVLLGPGPESILDQFPRPELTRTESGFEPEPARVPEINLVEVEFVETWKGTLIRGFLVRPRDPVPRGAILLLHDWWGLTSGVRKQALDLAAEGFVAFALDMYRGRVPTKRQDAVKLMRSLKKDDIYWLTAVSLDWLDTQSSMGSDIRTGVVGWGIGGLYALELPVRGASPEALVLFCSEPIIDPQAITKIQCPLLGFYASRDAWITPQRVRSFESTLQLNGHRHHEMILYDTLPGFSLKPSGPLQESYAETAQDKMVSFLKGHLQH
jgi:carboxymethylenebutenolidase